MSRIAKLPVSVPSGVEVKIEGKNVVVKGAKGSLQRQVHTTVDVRLEDGKIEFSLADSKIKAWAQAGTERSLVNNMIIGVAQGYEKKLELFGVGYRAQMKGKVLSLALGYSHSINFSVPEGIQIETLSQTEIVVRGIDKQAVGQVAAEIRSFRPPEPYKGKGVRYANERIRRKEVKKS